MKTNSRPLDLSLIDHYHYAALAASSLEKNARALCEALPGDLPVQRLALRLLQDVLDLRRHCLTRYSELAVRIH